MKVIAFLLAFLTYSTGASAACTQTDLTGSWVTVSDYSPFHGVKSTTQCNLTLAKGVILNKSNCTRSISPATAFPVTGTLSIDSSCRVAGSIIFPHVDWSNDFPDGGIPSITLDAYLSKGKDSLTGTHELTDNGLDTTYNDVGDAITAKPTPPYAWVIVGSRLLN